MARVSALNWHRDGWLEVEAALTCEGCGPVVLAMFLPRNPDLPDRKLIAVWDGETCRRVEARRGALTRIGPFEAPASGPLRLHLFISSREATGKDNRRLGGHLRLETAEEPEVQRAFDPAGPGRGFLPHPDRALVAEFLHAGHYRAQFAPRDVPSDLVLHYLTLGWVLGLEPAPGFRAADHLEQHPEAAGTDEAPFLHFLRHALGEGATDPQQREPARVRALAALLRGEAPEAVAPAAPAGAEAGEAGDGGGGGAAAEVPLPAAPAAAPLRSASALLAAGNRAGALAAALEALRDPATEAAAAAALPAIIGTAERWERIAPALDALFDTGHYPLPPTAARAGLDPLRHYLLEGWKAGLSPSPLFDPRHYARQLPGGLPDGAFPLAHFHAVGRPAGLRGVPAGTALWPVPDLPPVVDWPLPPVSAGGGGPTAGVVYVVLDRPGTDPRPALHALLTGMGLVEYAVTVLDAAGEGAAAAPAGLAEDLTALAGAGRIALVPCGAGVRPEAALRDLLAGHDPRQDAVLLHPAALVPAGWFDRLLAHRLGRGRVASVTALSSDADCAAYPRAEAANRVAAEGGAAALDRLAQAANAGLAVPVPRAGGACVLIAGEAVESLGLSEGGGSVLDVLSDRAASAGWTMLAAGDLYVPCAGPGAPAGPGGALDEPALARLAETRPLAADRLRRHQTAQPLRPVRRALDLARLAASDLRGGTLHVTHRWGGGIETHLRQLRKDGTPQLLLRLHDGHRLSVETDPRRGPFLPNLEAVDLRAAAAVLGRVLAAAAPSRIVVHSLSGLDWPAQQAVLAALTAAEAALEFVVHDYAAISAQYCLLSPEMTPWRGVPGLEELRTWAAMEDPLAGPAASDPAERQAAYGALLRRCRRVVAPSGAAAAILRAVFPDVAVTVVPHAPHLPPVAPPAPRRPDGRLRIAVPGKLTPQKGSAVLEALAQAVRAAGLPVDLRLVGHSDIDARLRARGVAVTGPYERETEAIAALQAFAPDLLFIPSLWPETFCYTLSFAPALGLRAAVFDLGAQAERARGLADAAILPLALAEDPAALAAALWALRPEPAAAG